MVYKLFDKKISDNGFEMENMSDRHLTEELHKSVIKNFKKRKVQSPVIDNIWGAYLADMQSISKFNRGYIFLLCAIDIANMHGLFLWKVKKVLQLPLLFIKLKKNLIKTKQNMVWYGQWIL